jgi:ribonuclease D
VSTVPPLSSVPPEQRPPVSTADGDPPVPLVVPRDGVPPLVDRPSAYHQTVAAFAAGTGPVAVDAERASGHRYGQRAYLVQLRRTGAGTALIDPIACPDLSALGGAIQDAEWVLHAANQDLPCLADLGLRPTSIFDTELAGRLAGLPRVGLASMVESLLGLSLSKGKEHSAADWSRRPLPAPLLTYAALDVEVLVDLRDALERELQRQGKLGWAREEFAAILAAPVREPRAEPWRRTSGIHRVHGARQLAAVRALWQARDRVAREHDVAPGRVLPDAAIVEAARAMPGASEELLGSSGFRGRGARRHLDRWMRAIQEAARIPADELPMPMQAGEGPPPAHRWADRDPAAAKRLARARAALSEIGTSYGIPVENLLAPDLVRRLAWNPPEPATAETVAQTLRGGGARAWQVRLTADRLARAFVAAPHQPHM